MDIKQEAEADSEIMDEIVNDIKTMNDGYEENEEDTNDEVIEKSLNRIVKTELDEDISFNETETTYSLENCDVSVTVKAGEENNTGNDELSPEGNGMKDEDFITDASVKMEDEIYQHTDDSLDIVGNGDNDFDLECVDKVDNDFISGKETGTYTRRDPEVSDSGKESENLFKELSDTEVDYGHETDSYDEEYESKIGIIIKREKSDDFEQMSNENLKEGKDQIIDYGRKTKKAKHHVCDLCRKAFTSDNRLKCHKKQLHPDGGWKEKPNKEGKYLCEVCNKKFISQSRLRLHAVTHTGEKPFSCDFCDQKFSHPTNKRRHMKTHTGDKPFVCLFCGKSFPVKHYLKDHMVKHTGEKPHECKLCSMTFAHRFSLKQHELLKHPGGEIDFNDTYDDRPFSCEFCGKRFTQQSSLKIHNRLHTGAKPYKCTECEASFIRSDSLLRHKFEHSGNRPFRCVICEKAFTSAYILKQHLNVHTGDRRQQCEHCGVELANKESLARHMMRHTGKSFLECMTCHKKFVSEQSLKRHGEHQCVEKIYKCLDCDYKNNSESKLKRHMLKHNAQKLLECEICKNKFTYPSNLKRHMKVHEKNHERETKKTETLISNDNVGNFIAVSMKNIVTENYPGEIIPKSKKQRKKHKKSSIDSENAVDLFNQTEQHVNELEVSKHITVDENEENSSNCIDGENKVCTTAQHNSKSDLETTRFEQENGYSVEELKQNMNKDVKMKAFYTLQYYDYVARLKGQDDTIREPSLGRLDIKNQKIDKNFAESNAELKGVQGYNGEKNQDIEGKSEYSYIDKKRREIPENRIEAYTDSCDIQKLSNLDGVGACQCSSCDLELSQDRLTAENSSYKDYESVDSDYRTLLGYQQRRENGNVKASLSRHCVASDWSSFAFNAKEKNQDENDTLNKFSQKLQAVSSSSYASIGSKMLPSQEIYSNDSQTQYSAVPYNEALFAGRLPAFAGSFYAQHKVNAARSTMPSTEITFGTGTVPSEDLASISSRSGCL